MPSRGSHRTCKQTEELQNGHEKIPHKTSEITSSLENTSTQGRPLEARDAAVSSQAVEDSPANEARNIAITNLESSNQTITSPGSSAVSGELLSPVQYPETMEHPMDKHCLKNDWCSHLLVQATQKLLQETALNQAGYSNELLENSSSFPRADVVIRPVQQSDIKGILDIANVEVQLQTGNNNQVIHKSKLRGILNRCNKELRPFIVATLPEDELLDRTKWPAHSDTAFAKYVNWSQEISNGIGRAPIVGFAYVDSTPPNLLLADDSTKYFGYATVVVHPKSRNKKIGSALLDRVLLSTAPYHRSQVDFQWLCDDPRQIYEYPAANNARQYKAIYIETFQDNELKSHSFHKEWLERFGFEQVGRLSCAKKEVLDCVTVWHDMIIWELNVQSTSNLR